jgi:Zn-dependent protease with chaperone function
MASVCVIFSYAFTLLMAGACVYLPYMLLTRGNINLVQELVLFLCGLAMSATIIWSLIPRRDRFVPPGPLLSPGDQPRLFLELEQIAASFQEPMPSAVYLTPEVNAWVAQRGGIMGFGSYRVMGIGLPLMQVLSVSQFRAMLAHEFGHFYEGDTRLGPLVYMARTGMVRTLENLAVDSPFADAISRLGLARLAHAIVLALLTGYWKLFMRITQFVSRKQEYRADELACAVAGSAALCDGLRTTEGAAAVINDFWFTEVAASLDAGYRPPIAEGFGRFLRAPQVAAVTRESVERTLKEATTNAYDTHPSLRDRIAAMSSLRIAEKEQLTDPATTLLSEIDGLELLIVGQVAPEIDAKTLQRLDWAAIGKQVYVPIWKGVVTEFAPLIDGATVASLPDTLKKVPDFASKMRDPVGTLLTREQRVERACNLLWMAFALGLVNAGWEVQSEPGQFCLFCGSERINPIVSFGELRSGVKDRIAWRDWAERLGIANIPLRPESGC